MTKVIILDTKVIRDLPDFLESSLCKHSNELEIFL